MSQAATIPLLRRRFTVEEYYRMAEAGILSEDDRVELIEGEVVQMTPIGSGHAGTVGGASHTLHRRTGDRAIVRVQNPVRLSRHSEPQPDIALLRPRQDFYRTAHPEAADVLLIIEVAEASARYDREVKIPLYGRSGVPEAWLVDLSARTIEVYRDPGRKGYRTVRRVSRGERLSPQAFPDLELRVEDLLGAG